jgi:hypothetical protein
MKSSTASSRNATASTRSNSGSSRHAPRVKPTPSGESSADSSATRGASRTSDEPMGEDKFVAAMIRKFRARVVEDSPSPPATSSPPRPSLHGILDDEGATCRDCGQPMKWVKTAARGKKIPVDVAPAAKGVAGFELIGRVDTLAYYVNESKSWYHEGDVYTAHMNTCPEREPDEPEPEPEPTSTWRAPASPFCTTHSSHFCPCVAPRMYTKEQAREFLAGEYTGRVGKGKKKRETA